MSENQQITLTDAEVYIPIVKFINLISISTRRKPLAIEWAILESIKQSPIWEQLDNTGQFKRDTVKVIDFASNVLMITDTKRILKQRLNKLSSNGIIRFSDEVEYIDEVCFSDVSLTDKGARLLNEGFFPVQSMDEKSLIYIWSLTGQVRAENKTRLVQDKEMDSKIIKLENKSLEDEPYPVKTIEIHEASKIKNEETTVLSGIQEIERSRLYEPRKLEVYLEEDGSIKYKNITDLEFNMFLDRKYQGHIENIFKEKFITDESMDVNDEDRSKIESCNNIFKFIETSNLIGSINESLQSKAMVIAEHIGERQINSVNQFLTTTDTHKNKFIIKLVPELSEVTNEDEVNDINTEKLYLKEQVGKNNNILSVNYNEDIKKLINDTFSSDMLLINDTGLNIFKGRIQASYKDNTISPIVTYSLKRDQIYTDYEVTQTIKDRFNIFISSILDLIINKIKEKKVDSEGKEITPKDQLHELIDIASMRKFILTKEEAWIGIRDLILETDIDTLCKIKTVTKVQANLENGGSGKASIKDTLIDLVIEYLNKPKKLSIAEIQDTLRQIPKINIYSEKEYAEKIRISILNLVERFDGYNDIKELNNTFEEYKMNKNYNHVPIELYTEPIILDLVENYKYSQVKLEPYTRIEETLNKLQSLEKSIRKELKIKEDMVFEFNPDLIKNDHKKSSIVKIQKDSGKWIETWDSLLKEFNIEPNECELTQTYNVIKEYHDLTNKYDTSHSGSNVYVLDTNAIINHPNIVNYFEKKDLVVIPKKVLSELDKKKYDSNLHEDVNTAIKNIRDIDNIKTTTVVIEESDISLIPTDYNLNADMEILSVVFKYITNNPVLVTDDIMFSFIAEKAEGIKCIKASELIEKKEKKENNNDK